MTTSTSVDVTSVNHGFGTPLPGWTGSVMIVGLVGALYGWVVLDLASEWWTDSASYGMLIPPAALYIAFLRRHVTLGISAQRDLRGMWLMALACLVFLLGGLAGEFFLMRISLVGPGARPHSEP
jgi:Transmembrane exosortase (Exosortase_EpsH)